MTTRRSVSLFVSSADADTAYVSRLLNTLSPWLGANLRFEYDLWDYRSVPSSNGVRTIDLRDGLSTCQFFLHPRQPRRS